MRSGDLLAEFGGPNDVFPIPGGGGGGGGGDAMDIGNSFQLTGSLLQGMLSSHNLAAIMAGGSSGSGGATAAAAAAGGGGSRAGGAGPPPAAGGGGGGGGGSGGSSGAALQGRNSALDTMQSIEQALPDVAGPQR